MLSACKRFFNWSSLGRGTLSGSSRLEKILHKQWNKDWTRIRIFQHNSATGDWNIKKSTRSCHKWTYRNKRSGAQAGRRTFCTPRARFMSSKARSDIRSFEINGSDWKTTVSSPSVKSSESFQKPEKEDTVRQHRFVFKSGGPLYSLYSKRKQTWKTCMSTSPNVDPVFVDVYMYIGTCTTRF